MSTYLPITTVSVKGLNSPFKRHRVAGWGEKKQKRKRKKQDPPICYLKETHFRQKDPNRK